MPLKGSLDANVLLRLFLNDVPEQHVLAAQLVEGGKNQLAVADVAIIEIVFVLGRNYGFTREQIAELVSDMASLPQIDCNRALLARVLPLFVKHPSVSFEDCCLAVYAELNDAVPLWTFDKDLAKRVDSASLLVSA